MIQISGFRKFPVIVDEIAKVVDLMRSYADVTISDEQTAGVYIVTSVGHGLNDFEVVEINDVDYVVNDITIDTFKINGLAGIDFVGETWKAKAPYFEHGHPLDIVSVLAEKDKAGTFQYQKYPLIALFQDFNEEVLIEGSKAKLNIIIANKTEPLYHAKDRYANNFTPVLYPILQQFDRALKISKDVQIVDPIYNKEDKLYWGKEGLYGNDGNIFNDYIDAIEINDLELKFKFNNCNV